MRESTDRVRARVASGDGLGWRDAAALAWTAGLILAGAGALLLVGCQAKHAGPHRLTRTPADSAPLQLSERLIAMDASAAEALAYVDHEQSRLPSGQIRVRMNLQNRHASEGVWMDWKVVFYDGRSFQVEETEWHRTFFPATEVRTLTASSIRPDSATFTVMLRRPATASGRPYRLQEAPVR